MKINSIQASNMVNSYTKQKQFAKTEVANRQLKDKVELSEDAKYLSKINGNDENVDIDKVNDIKRRLKEGTYDINSGQIAKKILSSIKGE